jgi:hypothetical protein
MDPSVWGKSQWTYLHCIASTADSPQAIADFVAYVYAMAKTLPCPKCKRHFAENIQKYPLENYTTSNQTLFMWTWIMHDAVNYATNKPRPTFQEIFKRYFDIPQDGNVGAFESDYQTPICEEVCTATAANANPVNFTGAKSSNKARFVTKNSRGMK